MLARCKTDGLDFVTGYRRAKRDGVVQVLADPRLQPPGAGMFGLDLRDTNCALKQTMATSPARSASRHGATPRRPR